MFNLIQHHTPRIEHHKQYEKKSAHPQNQQHTYYECITESQDEQARRELSQPTTQNRSSLYIQTPVSEMSMNIQTPSYYKNKFHL